MRLSSDIWLQHNHNRMSSGLCQGLSSQNLKARLNILRLEWQSSSLPKLATNLLYRQALHGNHVIKIGFGKNDAD